MKKEKIAKEAKKMTDELMGRGREGRRYIPDDLALAIEEGMREVVVERSLEALESQQQTATRHSIEARLKRNARELEEAKRDVRNIMGTSSDGEGVDVLASLHIARKKKLAGFQRRRREMAKKMEHDFFTTKTRDFRRQEQKIIDECKEEQKRKAKGR